VQSLHVAETTYSPHNAWQKAGRAEHSQEAFAAAKRLRGASQ